MTILDFLIFTLLLLPVAIVIVHVGIYLTDPYALRQYPGPFFAKFTHVWLAWIVSQGHRSEAIHELHTKYGPFVRISPSEISISDPDALGTIYNFTSGTQKSALYDIFAVANRRVLFSTRNRAEHARKRKLAAPLFSPKSILEYVPHIRRHIATLIAQWDRMHDSAVRGLSGAEGEGWSGRDKRLCLNCLPWLNYLTFDVISDLAFGAPLGMLESGRDAVAIHGSAVDVRPHPNLKAQEPDPGPDRGVTHLHAIAALEARAGYTAVMGVLPLPLRSLAARLPWFKARAQNVRPFLEVAAVAVAQRQAAPLTDRMDMLRKLQDSMNEEGQPLTHTQLKSEALGLFIAGSDTTSNSMTAIIYHIAANQQIQACLQEELDKHMATCADSESDDPVATAEQVKYLSYLEACIYEGFRVHSTTAFGLPREVPQGGLTVCGHSFLPGTTLGVPIYTIHRDSSIWGADVDVYRPERWLAPNDANQETKTVTRMHKMMQVFSTGPYACIGRQFAILEIQLALGTLFRRYHIVLAEPGKPLATNEGFTRKPVRCEIEITRRAV